MTGAARVARIRSIKRLIGFLVEGILALVVGLVTMTALPAAEGGKSGSPREKMKRLPPRVESPGAGKLTCDGRIVVIGSRMEEVSDRCGPPAWQQRLYDTPVADAATDLSGAQLSIIDEWIYNFGPDRLIRFLRFREGRLVGVRTDGYGFAGAGSFPDCREGQGLRAGMSKMEVVCTCGEPAGPAGSADPVGRRRAVERDEWHYDFGADQLVRTLRFRSGRLVEIVTGGYGGKGE